MRNFICTFREATRTEQITLPLIFICASVTLLIAFDDPVHIVKGIFFFCFLTAIAFLDFKSKAIPDVLLIPVALIGLIECDWSSFGGTLIVSVPMLLIALFSDGIGGGDIKFMAAAGFVLKTDGALLAGLIGFLIFVLIHFHHRKKQSYALAPALSIGCFLSFLLIES